MKSTFSVLLITLSLLLISGCIINEDRKPIFRIVSRKLISKTEFQSLVKYNRNPDILKYCGSKNHIDYFSTEHVIAHGGKPFQHNDFDISTYWIPSDQIGFNHHLPLVDNDGEYRGVYYDDYAPIDAYMTVIKKIDVNNVESGSYPLSVDLRVSTADGMYRVLKTQNETKMILFITSNGMQRLIGKYGFVYIYGKSTCKDLLRNKIIREGYPDYYDGHVLLESPVGFETLSVDEVKYDGFPDFFSSWFRFNTAQHR